MRSRFITRISSALVVALCAGVITAPVAAGEPAGGSSGGANPYRLVRNFINLPPGVKLGAVSGVATDARDNLYVFHRGDPARPILVFDSEGKFLRSFGERLFTSTHALRIDPDGNIWTTDNANHTVVKFSPDGKVLLTLGVRDVAGQDETHFNKPTDVAFARDGSFYVSDGYGNS